MRAPDFETLAPEYRALFARCDFAGAPTMRFTVSRIVDARERYEAVAQKFANQLPWFAIALIHAMEADLNFGCHLHNGDPLTRRTAHEPAGRPLGQPPFTWEESADDALRFDHWDRVPAARWADVAGVLYQLESYNGWGSRVYHGIRTPYLWAGSNLEMAGKYIADDQWSATAKSAQLGAAVILKALVLAGEAVFRAVAVRPASKLVPFAA